jgi:16S rRNA (guanine966-N2)-methyltransferase
MRIVAGRLKGRSLAAPKSDSIRPTSDRLRETIFNILAHGLMKFGISNPVECARVLDLFAGTGGLAIEALSRGASFAVMVDEGTEARGLLRGNVESCGLGGITKILRRDATKLGEVSPFEPFNILFCDPPYGKGLGEKALQSALQGGWLVPGAIVVLEERQGLEISLPEPITLLDQRVVGEAQIFIGHFRPNNFSMSESLSAT